MAYPVSWIMQRWPWTKQQKAKEHKRQNKDNNDHSHSTKLYLVAKNIDIRILTHGDHPHSIFLFYKHELQHQYQTQ
jgi:hypothetical protein